MKETKEKYRVIDLSKTISYACGKTINSITMKTNCPDKSLLEKLIK